MVFTNGNGNACVLDAGKIIKTVENPGGKDLTKVGVNKIAPEIVSKTFAIASNPLGLLVAYQKPPRQNKFTHRLDYR